MSRFGLKPNPKHRNPNPKPRPDARGTRDALLPPDQEPGQTAHGPPSLPATPFASSKRAAPLAQALAGMERCTLLVRAASRASGTLRRCAARTRQRLRATAQGAAGSAGNCLCTHDKPSLPASPEDLQVMLTRQPTPRSRRSSRRWVGLLSRDMYAARPRPPAGPAGGGTLCVPGRDCTVAPMAGKDFKDAADKFPSFDAVLSSHRFKLKELGLAVRQVRPACSPLILAVACPGVLISPPPPPGAAEGTAAAAGAV